MSCKDIFRDSFLVRQFLIETYKWHMSLDPNRGLAELSNKKLDKAIYECSFPNS